MPSPASSAELIDLIRKSGVVEDKRLAAYVEKLRAAGPLPTDANSVAVQMVGDGLLTRFQAEQLLMGKWRRFTIGKYKVLERLGAGGMGSVYLCEHKLMRRRVAVKVLPTAKAEDPAALERFYREARAVAALDHPNIVRAYDIDQDEKLHFLVMEHVDGANLQEILKKTGPMEPMRACHYIRQAALGLQHAHETAGLVHRDIKPGNVLVDRNGIVKILDMGLARFFHDEDDVLTKKYDENVLGTADYLAPEQALDSHGVDIRADVYSLGATFYFCLTGRTPFSEGTVAQKLIWHQTRQPKSLKSIRSDVPDEVVAIIEKMMAKDPAQRYQTPLAVAESLAPLIKAQIPPPPENEMPQLSPAAMGLAPETISGTGSSRTGATADMSPTPRKNWQLATPAPSQSAPPPGPRSGQASSAPPPDLAVPGTAPETLGKPALSAPTTALPAPVPAAPASTTMAPPPPPPQPASWDQLAPETEDLTARADTDRSSKRRKRATRKPVFGEVRSAPQRSNRFLWLVAGGATVFIGLILISVWLLSSRDSKPQTENAPDQAEATRGTRVVDATGANGAAKSLSEAVMSLPKTGNMRILIKDDVLEESNIYVLNVRNVTIEPAEAGKTVIWTAPRGSKPDVQLSLIRISKAENFVMKGIAFDGMKKAGSIISLFDHCQGLLVENCQFKDFLKYGIRVTNCQGQPARPVVFRNLKITTNSSAQRGIFFDINPNMKSIPVNLYFEIANCTFAGPGLPIATPRLDPKVFDKGFVDQVNVEPNLPIKPEP